MIPLQPNSWVTLVIVVIIFIGIAIGRYPIIQSNRTTIALLGVALLIVFRQIRFEQIQDYLDFNTLILLFSMMIINANLKLAGFFSMAGQAVIRLARTPRAFLAVEIGIVGVLSALFLNDTICLMFTPLLLNLTDSLKRNPIPYLVALATASNIGSTATLTGNPQNMIIGVASGIAYIDFSSALAPVAVLGLGVVWIVLVYTYRQEFPKRAHFGSPPESNEVVNRPLLTKTLIVTTGMLAAFIAGAPIALASFIAANILLITRRHQPHTIFAEFDWSLLVFFAGLFIVSGSLETSGVIIELIPFQTLTQQVSIANLAGGTAVLSNLISNVPAVLLLRPVPPLMADPKTGWLTIAAASTLAGNLTLLGSVANLIVAETASRWRVDLSFWEYTRSGLIITLLTLAIAVLWLTVFL